MKIKFILLLLILFWAIPAQAQINVEQPPLPVGSKIMLVGDSLAVGLSHRFKILAKEFGYVPIVDAKQGTTITQWASWMPQKLKQAHPDLVLASIGTNDSVSGLGESIVKNPEKIDFINKEIHDFGINILWIGIPSMPDRLPYANSIDQIIEQKAQYYFKSSTLSIRRSPDKIHCYPKGYSDWMDSIWTQMLFQYMIEDINEED